MPDQEETCHDPHRNPVVPGRRDGRRTRLRRGRPRPHELFIAGEWTPSAPAYWLGLWALGTSMAFIIAVARGSRTSSCSKSAR